MKTKNKKLRYVNVVQKKVNVSPLPKSDPHREIREEFRMLCLKVMSLVRDAADYERKDSVLAAHSVIMENYDFATEFGFKHICDNFFVDLEKEYPGYQLMMN